MLESSQKKRIVLILALFFTLIVGIYIWFFLTNRITVTFIAKAPYTIETGGIQTNCLQDECQIIFPPGNYFFKITKEGYRQIEELVVVTSGSQNIKKLDLPLIPTLREVPAEEVQKFFIKTKISDEQFKTLSTGQVFYDENAIVYLRRNNDTNLQTLYSRTLENGILGPETAITSFQRPFRNYLIFPRLKEQRIILVDSPDQDATLYFIDVQNKTRQNILSMASVKNLIWLPSGSDFLIEGKEELSIASEIFRYSFEKNTITRLPLNTTLQNIIPLSSDRLIIAFHQIADENLQSQEGKIIDLETFTIFAEVAQPGTVLPANMQKTDLSFIDFSLVSMQGRLIKNFPDMAALQELQLSDDKKEILFKSGEKFYILRIRE